MPKLSISLEADGSRLEGQMSSQGQRAAQRFNASFDSNSTVGNSILNGINKISTSIATSFNRIFGNAGSQAATSFGQQFKQKSQSGGVFAGSLLGDVIGGTIMGKMVGQKASKGGIFGPGILKSSRGLIYSLYGIKDDIGNLFGKSNDTSGMTSVSGMMRNYNQQQLYNIRNKSGKIYRGLNNFFREDESMPVGPQLKSIFGHMGGLGKSLYNFGRNNVPNIYGKISRASNSLTGIGMGGLRLAGSLLGGGIGLAGRAGMGAYGAAKSVVTWLPTMLAGLGVTAAFKKLVENTLELANKLNEMSLATGYSVNTLQALEVTTKKTGTKLETLMAIDEKAQQARIETLQNPLNDMVSNRTLRMFNRLGISREELVPGNVNMMELLAKKYKGGANQKEALGEIIGLRNIPSFVANQGALSDIAGTTARETAAGNIANPNDILRIKEVKDELALLGNEIETSLLPTVASLGEIFITIVDKIIAFIKTMGEMGSSIDKFGGFAENSGKIIQSVIGIIGQFGTGVLLILNGVGNVLSWVLAKPMELLHPVRLMQRFYEGATDQGFVDKVLNGTESKSKTREEARVERHTGRVAANEAMNKNSFGQAKGPVTPDILPFNRVPQDELLNIGNFLGGNVTSLSDIGLQQLNELRKHSELLQRIIDLSPKYKKYNPLDVGFMG